MNSVFKEFIENKKISETSDIDSLIKMAQTPEMSDDEYPDDLNHYERFIYECQLKPTTDKYKQDINLIYLVYTKWCDYHQFKPAILRHLSHNLAKYFRKVKWAYFRGFRVSIPDILTRHVREEYEKNKKKKRKASKLSSRIQPQSQE